MTATNHDDQLGEIHPTTLNKLNCTFGVSFSRFHYSGRHVHGLWPSWYRPISNTAQCEYIDSLLTVSQSRLPE